MLWSIIATGAVLAIACLSIAVNCQSPLAGGVPSTSIELAETPSYLVLTPRKIRPELELGVSATVFRMLYDSITFRVSIRRIQYSIPDYEINYAEETFTQPGSRIIRLKAPENIPEGNYSIFVEGSVESLGGLLFQNRTELVFEPRVFSVYIQFSKPLYAMGDLIKFRVIPYEFNLMVKNRLFTSVELVDPNGIVVRRWLSPRTNARGYLELSFQLPPTCSFGEWKVRCNRESFVSEKKFTVSYNVVKTMCAVNLTLPLRLSEFAFGVYGILEANHTTNVPSQGNATIRLEFRPRWSSVVLGTLVKEIPYFLGRSNFLFTMQEIQAELKLKDRPADLDVYGEAFVFDWNFLVTDNNKAQSVIFREVPDLKFLGGRVRQFKPELPYTAYIRIFQADGRKPDFRYRYVSIEVYCDTSALIKSDSRIPVPDDSVIRYTIQTGRNCTNYRLFALLKSSSTSMTRTAEQFVFRHYSPSGAYLRVTTSTDKPSVDKYMVFNIRTTYYTQEIHYLIQAAGNILSSDIIRMPAGVLSKTFSIAISREMSPVARMVVYFMKPDGELVTDSFTFFVELLRMNSVKIDMHQGSDLSGKTVTGWVSGASPGSFILLSTMPYDLYLRYGSRVILEPNALIEELLQYESFADQPLRYRWFDDISDTPKARYFPSHTLGPDANKTMNFSGLIMFTDSNYSSVSFWHTCNETLNPERVFPCYTKPDECYGYRQKCDGKIDCLTGVDEMNCESDSYRDVPGYVEPYFEFMFRHFIYDEDWLWQDLYAKPFLNGKVPINTAVVPKLETGWVIGAIAIDSEKGIQVQEDPTMFTSTRRFYMRLEAPKSAFWGEQLGIRVALFNRWDYWIEVLVVLKKSKDYDFVSVGAGGQVNSYSPELVSNSDVHSLVYLRGGGHTMIYFPVLPRQTGKVTISFCTYSFIGGECSAVTIPISINGVANSYSSPILIDLVDNSELLAQNFFIIAEQTFVEPEKRWRRYVPGSKAAYLTVVGDIVGPTLGPDQPYCDASCSAWKPVGSAESVLFNMNRNVQMLHYLRMTKQLQDATLKSTLTYVNTQFARLTFFIEPTSGGISNFPERFANETSTFLTALGLYTLAETSFSEWDQITYISPDIFKKLLIFLNATQVRTGDPEFFGSFTDSIQWDLKYFNIYINDVPVDPAFHPYLERVTITALSVLATSHPSIPKPLGPLASTISSAALSYLRRHLPKMGNNALCLAMTAYALTFDSDTTYKFKARDMLLSSVRTDNYLYWAVRRLRSLIREPDTAGKVIIKPRIEWPNDAFAVEATGFALLALFKTGSPSTDSILRNNITKIVHFLSETKNMAQGWISTQDTIIAIRALREIAQLDLNRVIYNIRVDISPSSDVSKSRSIFLDGSNLTVPQTYALGDADTWGEVTVKASGSGRAVLQLYVTKSVENEFQVKNAADPVTPENSFRTFEVSCVPNFAGKNGSLLHMTSCARWLWTERSETSGMAILSYTLPSGFFASNYKWRNFVQGSNVRGLRHIWLSGNTVNLFFSNITSTETTCTTLTFPRFFPVANVTIEHSCSVYEYFENDNGNFTLYKATSLHSADICKVCGSFQCPYCPDYNFATVVQPTVAVLLAAVALLLMGWRKATIEVSC
ncbi:hypothetical protein BOX15_Mlig019825g2 [Macrostomum lignano]|uniref:A2M domain-containing protein n=1 Tax=Macrostomum lignano TaxID=282301 RepID=A0A267EPF3_9PLAT|nr:hypothetical protein BOX15_Mlig019825g2 [Macrostomum lignano]